MKYEFNGKKPAEEHNVFIAPGAHIIGDVKLKNNSSVWYNTVIRADLNEIVIGSESNIQDNSTIHCYYDIPAIIESRVTVGHNSVLHGCHIEEKCLIGMGAKIMNEAKIGSGTIIGAGAVIPEGKKIPQNSLVLGAPGKVVRDITAEEREKMKERIEEYIEMSREHAEVEKIN